jgi:hypothetical protein
MLPRLCGPGGYPFMTVPGPEEAPWFRRRGYRHFDTPIDLASARALAENPDSVSYHPFLPFIAYSKYEPRYKHQKDADGNIKGHIEFKERPIAYSAHGDSAIFAYYAALLQERYEAILQQDGISECVLAYRKFPGKYCNIHFARDAFKLIDGSDRNIAIGLDVEKFFDTLDHVLLKKAWREVLGCETLPVDHYKVFRTITKFAKVNRKQLYTALGIGRRQAIKGRGPLCDPSELRNRVRPLGLINTNPNRFGIPQGSPISAIASNIYMLPFDRAMKAWCDGRGAIYRRYSDDILVLCNKTDRIAVEDFAEKAIKNVALHINRPKTISVEFDVAPDGALIATKPLQYLGFLFDGNRILLRSQSLARYHRRTASAISQARWMAIKSSRQGGTRKLRRRHIYERSSHLNRKQSFPEYVYRAAKVTNDPAIKKQFKGHWPKLQERLKKADTD